jgi:hypothetical protein
VNDWRLILAVLCPFLLGVLAWSRTRLRYRITRSHLKIYWFGIPVRRCLLQQIDYISKHQRGWAEHWENTWRSSHRRLVIHRRRGLVRQLVISPVFRYEFRRELEAAVAAIQGPNRLLPEEPAD